MSFRKPGVGGGGEDFTPAPEGMHEAVLAGIVDRGYRVNRFDEHNPKVQRKVQMVWALDAYDEETGDQFLVFDWLTLSMHKRATMRQRFEAALGKKLTDEQAKEFDLVKPIGKLTATVVVEHTETNGNIYANVQNLVPLKGDGPEITEEAAERIKAKDYTGSFAPNFDSPGLSRKLTDEEVAALNEMDDSIRENLVEAIGSLKVAAGVDEDADYDF